MISTKWHHLTPVQWVILIVFIAIANVFTITQRYVVPEMLRPPVYVIVVVLLFFVFFFIVRPDEPLALAQTLGFVLGGIAIVLIIIQDVILAPTLSWKAIVIFLGAIGAPFIAGFLYSAIRTPKSP